VASKNGKYKPPKKAWEVDFVECTLDKDALAELKSWVITPAEILDKMGDMIDDGYKITLSRDENATFVGAYATTKADHETNPKMCLGSRGATIVYSLKALLYKHYVLLDQIWGNRLRTEASDEGYR